MYNKWVLIGYRLICLVVFIVIVLVVVGCLGGGSMQSNGIFLLLLVDMLFENISLYINQVGFIFDQVKEIVVIMSICLCFEVICIDINQVVLSGEFG